MVGGQRRDTTPIVDAGSEQGRGLRRFHEVRRRLNPHRRSEQETGHGDGGEKFFQSRVRCATHRSVALGQKILHDDFLHMPESFVCLPDSHDRLGAVADSLSDADENARRERDAEPSGVGQRPQPDLGVFVRAAVVGLPFFFEQTPRGRLEHHAHRRCDGLEPGQLLPRHHPRVQVRQQTRLLEHLDRHRAHVIERGVVPARIKPLLRLRPAILGPVTESEQCFFATEFGALAGHLDDFVGVHEQAVAPRIDASANLAGHRDERAVVALVPAQACDRDEHLARIADGLVPTRLQQTRITNPRRRRHQIHQILAPGVQQHGGLVDVESDTFTGAAQNATHGGRGGSFLFIACSYRCGIGQHGHQSIMLLRHSGVPPEGVVPLRCRHDHDDRPSVASESPCQAIVGDQCSSDVASAVLGSARVGGDRR